MLLVPPVLLVVAVGSCYHGFDAVAELHQVAAATAALVIIVGVAVFVALVAGCSCGKSYNLSIPQIVIKEGCARVSGPHTHMISSPHSSMLLTMCLIALPLLSSCVMCTQVHPHGQAVSGCLRGDHHRCEAPV